jgi:hypothetical protein
MNVVNLNQVIISGQVQITSPFGVTWSKAGLGRNAARFRATTLLFIAQEMQNATPEHSFLRLERTCHVTHFLRASSAPALGYTTETRLARERSRA